MCIFIIKLFFGLVGVYLSLILLGPVMTAVQGRNMINGYTNIYLNDCISREQSKTYDNFYYNYCDPIMVCFQDNVYTGCFFNGLILFLIILFVMMSFCFLLMTIFEK
jgi:hypothetical protein